MDPTATEMLRLAVAVLVGTLESVTVTVKVKVPACVGVPEIWPEPEMEIPAGNDPWVTDQP